MRSRREQIRAYRFVTRRIVTALLGGDPDSADPPMRRAGLTTFASAMIAALVLAAFGVYGLVHPGGNTSWRQGGSLIVEKDTGTRFVYSGGRLHPVLNYASARLVLPAGASVVSVAADSLAGVPRGRPIGIPNAPDALPAPGALTGLPWSVCTAQPVSSVARTPIATVGVGRTFRSAADLADRGLLVKAGDGDTYLLWQGERLRIPTGAAMASLSWSNEPVLTVAPAFLNAVRGGPDLAPPKIDGAGQQGAKIGDSVGTIGTPYQMRTPSGSLQYYVLMPDGLAPTYEVTADLLQGETGTDDFERITPVEYDRAPKSTANMKFADVPDHAPALLGRLSDTSDLALCASFRGGRYSTVEVYRSAPRELNTRPEAAGGTDEVGGLTAGAVLVPGGGGALVRATAAPGVPTGTTYLVTDQGIRYGVPTADALKALGYGAVKPVLVPGDLLDLVPAGPVLDPAAAKLFADTGPSPAPSPTK
ncbi:MAG TPA: type VII secretion protein EccB [Actinocatenispora sp.]